MSRCKSMMLAIMVTVLAAGFACFIALPAYAEDGEEPDAQPVLHGETFYAKDGPQGLDMDHFIDDYVDSCKSSNTKVLKTKRNYHLEYGYALYPNKPGKAKVTVKCEKNGKKYTLKATYIVLPYPKAITKMWIDGKKVPVSAKKNSFGTSKKLTGESAAVKIKLNDGWDIAWARVMYFDDAGGSDQKDLEPEVLLQGQSFEMPKKYTENYVQFVLTKEGMLDFNYYINLNR